MSEVSIYADGSCLPSNPGPGGWASILVSGDYQKELTGCAYGKTTNQRMDLTAVIEGLAALKKPCLVTVYTESQYVQRGMTEWMEGWQKAGRIQNGNLTNSDLWIRLLEASGPHEVTWVWVSDKAKNELNTKVDLLAHAAARRARDEATHGTN